VRRRPAPSDVRRPLQASLALAALTLVVGLAPARGDHFDVDLPWPQLLPPLPSSPGAQPHPVANCERASIRCVDGLVRRLREQWERYDASCDHRAVIAYSYLEITKGLRDELAAPTPELVRYREWMTYLITTFSNRYFAAFRDYDAGRPVADAWRITFEAADAGNANAGQDVLLFSNAHVQHDLPFALEEMGLKAPDGASRKRDHDAVNKINSRVFDPIEDYIAAHYDPSFKLFDLKPLPLEELGVLELVKLWREGAWRAAERLVGARSPAARQRVVRSIEATSRLWAQLISSGGLPGTRAARDAYCLSH
jgi:hypothetical protein